MLSYKNNFVRLVQLLFRRLILISNHVIIFMDKKLEHKIKNCERRVIFMNKVIRKLISLALASVIGISGTSVFAVSETCSHGKRTFNDHKLTGGVGEYGSFRRYYWVDSSVPSSFNTAISDAVNKWVNTTSSPGVTTSISIRKTSVKKDSSFDLYGTVLGGTKTGLTEFWVFDDKETDPSSKNWGWNKIYIDKINTQNPNIYTTTVKSGLVAHEFGHAMGLSHQPSHPTDSIMYNYDNRKQKTPAKIDCQNINHIYG